MPALDRADRTRFAYWKTLLDGIPASSNPIRCAFLGTPRSARRRQRRLLLDRAAREDALRTRRFLAHQPLQAAADRRRRSCPHQRDALLRQPRRRDRRQAHHGVGRAAAGVSGGAHRRRAVLGRRHSLQHADGSDLRRQPAHELADLRRAPVESRWAPRPDTIWEVLHRQKDIQYSSRVASHIARQTQIHRLRHIIRELAKHLPDDVRKQPERARAGRLRLPHAHARRAAAGAAARQRGPHQGRRLQPVRHPHALGGRLRRDDARDRSGAVAGRVRSARGRHPARTEAGNARAAE